MLPASDELDDKKLRWANIVAALAGCSCFLVIIALMTLSDLTVSKWSTMIATVEPATVEVLSSRAAVSQLPFHYVVDGTTYRQTVSEKSVLQDPSYDAEARTLKIMYDPASPGKAITFSRKNLLLDYVLLGLCILALPCCFIAPTSKSSATESLRDRIRANTRKNAGYDFVEFEPMKPAKFTVEELRHETDDVH